MFNWPCSTVSLFTEISLQHIYHIHIIFFERHCWDVGMLVDLMWPMYISEYDNNKMNKIKEIKQNPTQKLI